MNDGIFVIGRSFGGSTIVAKEVCDKLNLSLRLLDELKSGDDLTTSYIFFSQPKAIFYGLRFFRHEGARYILDLHPHALSLRNRIIYFFLVFSLTVLAPNKTYIPYGPLAGLRLYRRFNVVNWSLFSKAKFMPFDGVRTFTFLGDKIMHKHKGYLEFEKIHSIMPKKIIPIYDKNLDKNSIYFWWGKKDSYGLLWRELINSKLMTICARLPSVYDDVVSAVYFIGDALSEDDYELVRWYSNTYPAKVIFSERALSGVFDVKS